ncbi:MAG TPA: hypothetical protein VHP13_12355 [Gammaproteobacteria bacterium]|jgi:hypothetical protein|nr:hypothetical protein [Gammaproteobacteria bacterium]
MPGSGFLYEPRHAQPLSRGRFLLRLLRHALLAQLLVLVSLGIGMWGYGRFEGMAWRDAFLNSAMLLGGMGPVKTEGLSDAGKLFAGLYALYAGLVLIVIIGIMLAPVIHRVLHLFHWNEGRGS